MAKITLTKAEAFDIIRKHFGVASDFEIEITDVQSSKDADDWIDVPSDWKHETHPHQAAAYQKIQAMYRNGFKETLAPTDWDYSWRQKGKLFDIIKWRPVK